MRAAPIGLFPARLSTREAFRLGAESAAITHGHPSGYLSAGALAAIVREIAAGAEPRDAARVALEELAAWEGHEETANCVEAALAFSGGDIAKLGEGWAGGEALSIGLYAAIAAADFRECLAIAANHGGDSDSTASIAGQIRGAWKGLSEIPPEWIAPLDVLAPLEALLERARAWDTC
jgi:ADP-ribosylglycohydrolase